MSLPIPTGNVEIQEPAQSSLLIKDATGYNPASTDNPVPVLASGRKISMAVEITREANATPYTTGDVISTGAAIVVPCFVFTDICRANGIGGYIVGARLITDTKSVTPRSRIHLYNDVTAVVSGDNLAHKTLYADKAKRIGSFDLAAMITGTDTTNSTQSASSDLSTLRLPFVPATASRMIYASVEALDGFTPGSASKFTLVLIVELD